jgi:tRNA U34 5-methylaminomethyl-2-thiouridine-forming methyltransferase MnmC
MPIPDRPRFPAADTRFQLLQTDDGSLTLEELASGDTFHSGCGAISECEHVYLRNSDVFSRLSRGKPTRVLELGFGTGLAFAITALEALTQQTPLHYTAIEARPLSAELMRQVLEPSLRPKIEQLPDSQRDAAERLLPSLLTAWQSAIPAFTQHVASKQSTGEPQLLEPRQLPIQLTSACQLLMIIGDANLWQPVPTASFDAIYFDPFSPASNPQLWSEEYLASIAALLSPEGRLVSYCVNSQVRRSLQRLGLQVERHPGPPGGKREVLVARPGGRA